MTRQPGESSMSTGPSPQRPRVFLSQTIKCRADGLLKLDDRQDGVLPVRIILAEATKHVPRPAQSGFLSLGIAPLIPGVLRELGTDPDPILKDAGLSHHLREDRTYRLSVSALGALLRLCAKRAHCPHF